VARQDVLFQCYKLFRQAFKRETKLFNLIVFSLPPKVRDDRTVDLHACGQTPFDGSRRETIGLFA
jgi:hypothetical protein